MKTVWAIFHRSDNVWVYKKTHIQKYINGLPLVQLELPHPAVTSYEFLFATEQAAKIAVEKRNR